MTISNIFAFTTLEDVSYSQAIKVISSSLTCTDFPNKLTKSLVRKPTYQFFHISNTFVNVNTMKQYLILAVHLDAGEREPGFNNACYKNSPIKKTEYSSGALSVSSSAALISYKIDY